MVTYSPEQESIARVLLRGAKSIEELRKETNLELNVLNQHMRGLIKLKVVEQVGAPSKYKLIDAVLHAVHEEDSKKEYKFESNFIVEGIGENKETVESQMASLEKKIKEKHNFKVVSFYKSETVKTDEYYSLFFEMVLQFTSLSDLVDAIINYGPTSVEVLKPKSVELNSYDIQSLASDVANAVHHYVTIILTLNREVLKAVEALKQRK